MRNRKETVEHKDFPGYDVCREGTVYSHRSERYLKPSRNPAGYLNVRLVRKDGHILTLGIHRLLCMCFKPRDGGYSDYQVNHIDGVKSNNDLDNLEWVTGRENVVHAGKNGLTPKCKPVVLLQLDTWKRIGFDSIVACARFLGVSTDTVNLRVNGEMGKRSGEDFIVVYENKLDELLLKMERDNSITEIGGTSKSVEVRYLQTGEIMSFDKLSDLALYLKMPLPTLSTWINSKDQPVLPGYLQMKLKTDKNHWREVGDIHLELGKTTGRKPVSVESKNGKRLVFESGVDCARAMGLSTTALSYRLKSKGRIFFSDGYSYAYYQDTL